MKCFPRLECPSRFWFSPGWGGGETALTRKRLQKRQKNSGYNFDYNFRLTRPNRRAQLSKEYLFSLIEKTSSRPPASFNAAISTSMPRRPLLSFVYYVLQHTHRSRDPQPTFSASFVGVENHLPLRRPPPDACHDRGRGSSFRLKGFPNDGAP